MSKAYFTDSLRSIGKTFSRFISIILIVAMGCGLFCGLNAVGPDMLDTANDYEAWFITTTGVASCYFSESADSYLVLAD